MKKYLAGFLMLGVMAFTGALPSKVNAGLTVAQQNIITTLQNAGATTQALNQVIAAFGMMPTSSTGTTTTSGTTSTGGTTTTTTTVSTGGTILPCTNNAAFNFTNGNPCSNYVPMTAGGTTTTTTTTTTTPTTGGPLFPPTTPSTPSTPSNCVSTQTNVAPYVYINGAQVQCVKACPVLTSASMNTSYWNINTTSMCPMYTPPPVIASITVGHPNGGETFAPGVTTGVKWESSNIPSTNDQVFILLNYYTPDGAYITSTKLVDTTTLNDGGEVVTLPTTLPAGASWGNNFKVTVGIASVATDDSDKNFIIQ